MNTYRNSSFSKTRVFALAALLAGSGFAYANGIDHHPAPSKMVNVGGRVQLDDVWFHGDAADKFGTGTTTSSADFPSGANIRRANVFLFGDFANDLDYFVRLDFGRANFDGNGEKNKVKVQRAELRYHYDNFKFTLGQMYVPFGMEWTTDASDLLFMERSTMSDALLERNHFGVAGAYYGEMFTVSAALVQKAFEGAEPTNREVSGLNDKFGGLARVTFAPDGDNSMWHLGLNGKYKSMHDTGTNGFWQTGPELRSRQSSTTILTTGDGTNAGTRSLDHFNVLGVEGAFKYNSFHAQAEYMRLRANYDSNANETYNGWYVQAGWIFTGEERPYDFKKGVFGRPVPDSGCGAWEVAARYSHLDLENPSFTTASTTQDTGKAKSWTLGLNWYLNYNVAFQANYSHTKFDFRNSTDRTAKGLGLRAQFEF